jgi:hypothetical protein
MKRSSITKFDKFFLGGVLLYIVPILFTTLILVNTIDVDEPKGPYDPNKNVLEPVFSDTIPSEPKKNTPKKIKSNTKPKQDSVITPSVIVSETIQTLHKNDSLN